MEVRRRAAVPRDGQLHQPNFEAHPQGHRHPSDRTRSRRAASRLRRASLAGTAGGADWPSLTHVRVQPEFLLRSLLTLALLLTTPAFAFTARLVDSDGKPVA